MAPTKKGKGKKPAPSPRSPSAVAPAVDQSIILNIEAVDKVCSTLATIFNDYGRTTVWPVSHASFDRVVIEMHMMHLGPESITLLDVFAFVCEAMVGIPPFVALLCHFFSLRLSDPTQCSGCVSFLAVPETTASGIDFGLPPPTSGFQERWLYVDVGVPSPLLSRPTLPAIPNSGWDHAKLTSPRLAFVWCRFKSLRALDVMAPQMVREFLECRIAPL
ncbi:hypothetical protein VPH35_007054 [Triticum aestivum]